MDITQQSTETHLSVFPAADGKGKYHAATRITGVAYCGDSRSSVILDTHAAPIVYERGSKPHPIICKRCIAWTKA